MTREPEVFVRELTPDEAQRLVKITRTARDRVRLRPAGIVLASVQGRSATEAAAMFAAKPQYAREVTHAFNTQGFAALDPKWSGGRPPKFGPHVLELICRVARTPPQQAGLAFTTWSLTKLVEHLAQARRVVASAETVRQIPPHGRGALAGHQDLEGQQRPAISPRRWRGSSTSTTAPPPGNSPPLLG